MSTDQEQPDGFVGLRTPKKTTEYPTNYINIRIRIDSRKKRKVKYITSLYIKLRSFQNILRGKSVYVIIVY